jgi:hypothetical protein
MVLFTVVCLLLSPVRFVSVVNANKNQDDCKITKKAFLTLYIPQLTTPFSS